MGATHITARDLQPGHRTRKVDARVHARHYMRPATPGDRADAVAAAGGAHTFVRRPHVGNRRTDGWAPTGRVVSTLPVDQAVITRRPWRDLSDNGRDAKGPRTGDLCPGCGMLKPAGRRGTDPRLSALKCDNCW